MFWHMLWLFDTSGFLLISSNIYLREENGVNRGEGDVHPDGVEDGNDEVDVVEDGETGQGPVEDVGHLAGEEDRDSDAVGKNSGRGK